MSLPVILPSINSRLWASCTFHPVDQKSIDAEFVRLVFAQALSTAPSNKGPEFTTGSNTNGPIAAIGVSPWAASF